MTLLVEEPGRSLLVQDLGRSGSAHLGVPPSGALDPEALALANRLVGNPAGGGRARDPARWAAAARATTRRGSPLTGGPGRRGRRGRVRVRGARRCRCAPASAIEVSAARDGICVPGSPSPVASTCRAVLGSRSTDTLTGLGSRPARGGRRAGDGRCRPAADEAGSRRRRGECRAAGPTRGAASCRCGSDRATTGSPTPRSSGCSAASTPSTPTRTARPCV